MEEKRRDDEDRRVEDVNFQFDYKPLFYPWCRKYTPEKEEVLEEVKRGLMNGDSKPLRDARQKGMDFVIDPANGTVEPEYALCLRKNHGDCSGFECKNAEIIP